MKKYFHFQFEAFMSNKLLKPMENNFSDKQPPVLVTTTEHIHMLFSFFAQFPATKELS